MKITFTFQDKEMTEECSPGDWPMLVIAVSLARYLNTPVDIRYSNHDESSSTYIVRYYDSMLDGYCDVPVTTDNARGL